MVIEIRYARMFTRVVAVRNASQELSCQGPRLQRPDDAGKAVNYSPEARNPHPS